MLCSLASDRNSRASTSGRASKAGGALERIGNLSPTKRRSTSDPKADGRNSVMGGRSPGGRSPGGRRSLERTKRMNITVFETKYSIVPEKVEHLRALAEHYHIKLGLYVAEFPPNPEHVRLAELLVEKGFHTGKNFVFGSALLPLGVTSRLNREPNP